jgi:hypothetical protein
VARFDNRDSGESTDLDQGPAPQHSPGAPPPRTTGLRTWPTTRPRFSTPWAGPRPISWATRWADWSQKTLAIRHSARSAR